MDWNIEAEEPEGISTPHKIGEDRANDAPFSDEVVVVSLEDTGGVSSRGVLGASRVSWILSLCPLESIMPLLFLVCSVFPPLLRVRSISSVTLALLGKGADRTRQIDTPLQILECHPHGFIETIRIPSLDYGLQYLEYVGTIFSQLVRIFVVNHLVLVG